MNKTLITFVGLGKPDGGGYIKTTYDFGDNKHIKSSCFAEAVRQSGKFSFDEVLFIGTATSSWSSLLESLEEQVNFWEELYSREIEKQPLTDDLKKELQQILQNVWQKPVRLAINPKELTAENCEEILNLYIGEIFDSGKDILLDVTHSFRWMPLLLSSALQFRNACAGPEGDKGSLEIVYGELGGTLSPVRYLDVWVKSRKTSDAIALFFQKFEAEPLAAALGPYWESGAKAVKRIGLYLQGNLFLPLLFDLGKENYPASSVLQQLKNVCHDFDGQNQPEWIKKTRDKLWDLYKNLTVGNPVERLIALSELLADRKLYGQAILLVCLAAEQSLLLAFEQNKHPGYEGLNKILDQFVKYADDDFRKLFLRDIKQLRNLIAHGGMSKKENPNSQPDALHIQYDKVRRKHRELHQYLQNSFIVK